MEEPNGTLERVASLLDGSGAGEWEVHAEETGILTVEAQEGAVHVFRKAVNRGLAVRVLAEGRPGFSFTADFSDDALKKTVESALAASRLSTADPHRAFPAPGPEAGGPPADLSLADPELKGLPEEKKVEMALDLEARILMGDGRVRKVRKAAYEERDRAVRLRNSKGLDRAARGTVATLSASAMAEENGDAQIGWHIEQGRTLSGLDLGRAAAGTVKRSVELLGARPVESRAVPAVLDPYVVIDLLEILVSSFSAESVQKGRSLLAGRSGDKVFSGAVTIIDDGALGGGFGSFPFDGEGVACRRNTLVAKGILSGFLYDTLSARREGRLSTGNAVRRDYCAPPSLGIANYYLEAGEGDEETLLAEMGDGVLVTDVIGAHTANPITGDFSVGCSGFVVKGGKRSFPFKGTGFSGNLVDLFARIVRAGGAATFVGRTGAPPILVERVDLSGT